MLLRDRFAPRPVFLMSPDEPGAAPPAGTTPPAAASPPAAAPPATPAAGTPAAGTKAAPGPLAAGDPPPTPAAGTPPADWPADWREKLAGDDKAFLGQLNRYASPLDVGKWVRTNQLKISAGELRATLKPDATAEEVAQYRKDNGLPDAPKGYLDALKLPDGTVPGEADKPILEGFAATALAKGLTPDAYNGIVSWWYDTQDKLAAERQEFDQTNRLETEQKLAQQWGPEFRGNLNALKSYWQGQPEGLADVLLTARASDGRILGDIPEVVEHFVRMARELNPTATLLPAGSEQGSAGIASRKAEIEKSMYLDGKPNPAYFGNEKVQDEYRQLIEAELKLASRAA